MAGSSFRLGAELEQFGVRWILATEPGQVSDVLDGQLDLFPLGLADVKAYEVEADSQRAVDTTGDSWVWEGPDYVGPEGTRTVRLAENGDDRWGEGWEAGDWANLATTESGRVRFGPIQTLQVSSWVALGWAALLTVGTLVVRRKS